MSSKSAFPAHVTLPEWPMALVRKATASDALWLVGGTVRDLLIKRPLHDWDFVTAAGGIQLAKRVADAFKGAFYVLDQNRETGRAIVLPPGSSQPITLDFATLRDSTLGGDLKKRDFTVNAMAMSLSGQLIDPLHCHGDLASRVIRMTTEDCFKQDPVRLLRAIRQSQYLDFSIDEVTYTLMCQQAYLISTISPERILSELCAMLRYDFTASSIVLLEETHILRHILPELKQALLHTNGKHAGTFPLWNTVVETLSAADHMLSIIENSDQHSLSPSNKNNTPVWYEITPFLAAFRLPLQYYFSEFINVDIDRKTLLKWAVLLHNVPVEEIRLRLTALRMPNKSLNNICRLIETYPLIKQMTDQISRSEIYKFYRQAANAGPGVIIFSLALAIAGPDILSDLQSLTSLIHKSRVLLQAFFEHADEFITPTPFLRGDDLIKLGVQPGPDIGIMLDRILEAQVTGHVTSRSSAVDFVNNQPTGKTQAT